MGSNLEKLTEVALCEKITKADREAIHEILFSGWGCMAQIAVVTICLAVGVAFLGFIQPRLTPGTFELTALAVLFITAGSALLPIRWRNRRVRQRVMAYLIHHNIRPHLCLNCEYDLKGSTADHCPECGAALAPVPVDDADSV